MELNSESMLFKLPSTISIAVSVVSGFASSPSSSFASASADLLGSFPPSSPFSSLFYYSSF